MDLITIGEILIDFLPGAEEGSYVRNAGGAPANVAIAAARGGLDTGIYCKVGDDAFGQFLLDTLEENHVLALSPVPCKTAVTTMAFVTLGKDNERSFTFARKPGADMMLSRTEIHDAVLSSCRCLHAGSFLLSGGDAADACTYAIRQAHALGKIVSFDINYRDMVWQGDRAACTDKVIALLPYIDLLKVSEEEVDMIGGIEQIPALMQTYALTAVVLTLGSAGAQIFGPGADGSISTAIAAGCRADVVADTTGAGDAFWGGFLSQLLLQGVDTAQEITMEHLKDAANYGNVCGSLAVRKKGAIASLPDRKEVEAFLLQARD